MSYKNMRELLVAGTKLPEAIEKVLPEGAPKLSTTLVDFANKVPEGPDFPMEIPDLPPPPEFTKPGEGALGRRYITEVEVTPVETRKETKQEMPVKSGILGNRVLS
jgi:hypothetical protein